jgi:hypothetical protein
MNTRLAVAAASLAVLASVTTAGLVNPAAYVEALRLGNVNYPLDPTLFPPAHAAALEATSVLGRLNVSTASGDVDGDGDFDRIEVFGARSFPFAISRAAWSATAGSRSSICRTPSRRCSSSTSTTASSRAIQRRKRS